MNPIEIYQDCGSWWVCVDGTISRFETREEAEDYYAAYA